MFVLQNPLYRPSQFTLFQDLTNSTMNLIDKSLSRPEERVSNLEEVLVCRQCQSVRCD